MNFKAKWFIVYITNKTIYVEIRGVKMGKKTNNESRFLKSLSKDISINILANLVTSLIIALITYIKSNIYIGIFCFFVLFFVFTCLFSFIQKQTHKKYTKENVRYKSEFKYKYLKKEVYFEYSTAHEHIYNTSHKICALQDNVNTFHGRYTWDASKVKMLCKEPPNSQIVVHPKKDAYHTYSIFFNDRKYNTGDLYNVNIDSIMKGTLKFPLFASTIIVPTDLLIIKIKLPLDFLADNNLRLITRSNPPEMEPPYTENAKLNKNGEYRWKIKNPELWHEYSIEWNFKNDILKVECPESVI